MIASLDGNLTVQQPQTPDALQLGDQLLQVRRRLIAALGQPIHPPLTVSALHNAEMKAGKFHGVQLQLSRHETA